MKKYLKYDINWCVIIIFLITVLPKEQATEVELSVHYMLFKKHELKFKAQNKS